MKTATIIRRRTPRTAPTIAVRDELVVPLESLLPREMANDPAPVVVVTVVVVTVVVVTVEVVTVVVANVVVVADVVVVDVVVVDAVVVVDVSVDVVVHVWSSFGRVGTQHGAHDSKQLQSSPEALWAPLKSVKGS